MAPTSISSASMAIFATTILFLLLSTSSEARDFLVGGSANAWELPSSTGALNKWAEASRFQIGDTLVWNLQGKNETVLQVSRESYLNCNVTGPLVVSNEAGRFEVALDRSGPYYFIHGEEGACRKGAKVIVVVMGKRMGFAAAPSVYPEGVEAPALSPEAGAAVGLRAGILGGGLVGVIGMIALMAMI